MNHLGVFIDYHFIFISKFAKYLRITLIIFNDYDINSIPGFSVFHSLFYLISSYRACFCQLDRPDVIHHTTLRSVFNFLPKNRLSYVSMHYRIPSRYIKRKIQTSTISLELELVLLLALEVKYRPN